MKENWREMEEMKTSLEMNLIACWRGRSDAGNATLPVDAVVT